MILGGARGGTSFVELGVPRWVAIVQHINYYQSVNQWVLLRTRQHN